ncbi:nucleoside hydrolase [Pleomorphovibrio marinus]|uniref:nucleoside hydrolase n=1 Tax=Pleomorphovibrio marinus TaxID=2164132 RepID=UPI000E0CBE50|nr:nucleoside hydrolase [Pleomorphovibrio marinus]
MKKIMNKAEIFLDEMIEGILTTHPGDLTVGRVLRRIALQYPGRFFRRKATVMLAFGLIFGLPAGFAAAQGLTTNETFTALVIGQDSVYANALHGNGYASKSWVSNAPVEVIVPLEGPVLTGKPVTFKLNGNPSNPHWELGDGTTAYGKSVSHTYQEPGFYRIVMGSKEGDTFKELSSAIVRVHTPETLHLPQVLLDTDARNEIDDQHYIGYGLFSNMDVLGINSVHHGPHRTDRGGDAQEQMNYGEIIHILALSRQSDLLMHRTENLMPQVFHGSKAPLQAPSSGNWQDTRPVKSEASEAILAAARGASPDNPVWVLPVGPCTNIANAILLAREEGLDLKSRIKIIWLGGGPEQVNVRSFNGENDPWSVYVTGQSGIEFWILLENPTGASLALDKRTDLGLYPKNKLGDYLVAISNIWSTQPKKALYDVAVVSMVVGKHLGLDWLTSVEPSSVQGPDQEYRWQKVESSTDVYIIREIDAEAMKADFFNTLNGKPTELPPMR